VWVEFLTLWAPPDPIAGDGIPGPKNPVTVSHSYPFGVDVMVPNYYAGDLLHLSPLGGTKNGHNVGERVLEDPVTAGVLHP
jgi:hypothetical protein